jgi:DNA-binding response OmpR family regulator
VPTRIAVVFVVEPDVLVEVAEDVRARAWSVRFATSTEEAWEGISLLDPDVVVVDLRVGVDVASELTHRAGEAHRHTTFLALVPAEDAETDVLDDFDASLALPATSEEVIAQIESLARLARERSGDR